MTAHPTILVVEDGNSEREALARVLRLEQYSVLTAENPQKAMAYCDQPVDLVLSDLRMGKLSGLDLLRYWHQQQPQTPFVMITAYGDVESAVTAMKLGATDYLTKPVDPDSLLHLIRHCLRGWHPPENTGDGITGLRNMVAVSSAMLEICYRTRRVAQTESTVLILGESGTGKELIAHAIHELSPRCDGPYVLVNMAAIPDTLVESELFGHVKGAYTGAVADRIGCFERAHGGTIFVDEIGDFPASSQAKLLRVLENRTISRVGSSGETGVNVRVVAATSHPLRQMVADGNFREDLYYRLNVVVIHLPPLRERREDIPVLARHFLKEFCRQNHRPSLVMDAQLLASLTAFDWPGNVRQLRNCLESMVVMAQGEYLTLDDLPQSLFAGSSGTVTLGDDGTLGGLERTAILKALREHRGNRTRTAEALGISVRTLQRRLKEWGVFE